MTAQNGPRIFKSAVHLVQYFHFSEPVALGESDVYKNYLTKIFTLEVLETGCTTLSVYDQTVHLKIVKMGTCNVYFITMKDLQAFNSKNKTS